MRHEAVERRAASRGMTLLVALIMMTALSLLAAWAARSSTTNLRAVGNMQVRQEAFAAAQSAIELTLSSNEFADAPAALDGRQIAVDVDGDGTADQSARLTPAPRCYRMRMVKLSELDETRDDDRPCLRSGGAAMAGLEGGSAGTRSGDSYCAETEWAVRAQVTDPASGAQVALSQAAILRDSIAASIARCP
jgi:PilX N-terminal